MEYTLTLYFFWTCMYSSNNVGMMLSMYLGQHSAEHLSSLYIQIYNHLNFLNVLKTLNTAFHIGLK